LLGHCDSSLSSCDECRLSAKRPPTLGPSHLTWAVSLPVGCHHLHPPSPFIIITQGGGWYSFHHLTSGRMPSHGQLVGQIGGWLHTEMVYPSIDGYPLDYAITFCFAELEKNRLWRSSWSSVWSSDNRSWQQRFFLFLQQLKIDVSQRTKHYCSEGESCLTV